MKNIIIIVIILFSVIICPQVSANPYFRAEMTGFPVVTENSVSANVNLTYMQTEFSKLFVMSTDNFITNNEDPDIKIPVSDLYILCDGEQFQISNNGWQCFCTDNSGVTGSLQKNINLKLENIGELPSGTYSIILKFLNKTGNAFDYECELVFTFLVDEQHSVILQNGDPVIVLSEDDIFNKQTFIKNQNDARLVLYSNTKWKLWLNTASLEDENCEYYFQIKNVSGKVSTYEPNCTKLLPNKRYLIASGEPTLDGIETGNKIPAYITIEYLFKNTDSDNYIKEGVRQNPFTYILERE